MFHEVIYSRIHGGLVWLVKRLSSCRVFSTANTATTSCSCVVCWMYGFINVLCMPLLQACACECMCMYMIVHVYMYCHIHVHTTLNCCIMPRVTHMHIGLNLTYFVSTSGTVETIFCHQAPGYERCAWLLWQRLGGSVSHFTAHCIGN